MGATTELKHLDMPGAACGHAKGQGEDREEEARTLCACCKTEVGVKKCSGCHRCLFVGTTSEKSARECSPERDVVLA